MALGQVRRARAHAIPVILLHDVDSCEFDRFFESTPPDLVEDGLFKKVTAYVVCTAPCLRVCAKLLALAATPHFMTADHVIPYNGRSP